MIIKTDGFELEISKGGEVYLGSLAKGQTFLNWSEIDDALRSELEKIMSKAEELIKDSESLLCSRISRSLQGKINNVQSVLNI